MKHVFIVNPAAGNGTAPQTVRDALNGRSDCEIYETKSRGDATEYIRQRCSRNPAERVCYVACGGDGTINEVASGLAENPNVCMTVFPLGSGNDFVKAFGGSEKFRNMDALLAAKPRPIDILKVGDRWAVNAFHFGLDAYVAKTMIQVKAKPVIGGKNAYPTGVAKALLFGMRTGCRVNTDGENLYDGSILLCTVANGTYVGGSYHCAPRSLPDDGYAEICLIKTVTRVRFLRMMDGYKEGKHLDDPAFRDYIFYRRGKTVDVSGKPGFIVSLDGEIVEGTHFHVEVIPDGLQFAAV